MKRMTKSVITATSMIAVITLMSFVKKENEEAETKKN